MQHPSVLVVDDEPVNFDVIETLLGNQPYCLHYADSGQEAIAVLDVVQPDLILLDVMMPEMDGLETCCHIKAMPAWQMIPIIMVTALNTKSDLAHCLSAGADDFISKPVNSVELHARIQSLLRIKQQYDRIDNFSLMQASTIQVLESTLGELRGNLAYSLSHELNTPLNGVLGTLSLLKDSLAEMEISEMQEMLGWAYESARRLEMLTNKFLIYLELELFQDEVQPWELSQTTLSQAAIAPSLKSLAQRSDREADLSCQLDDAAVNIPEKYLKIVIHELVENALKFSPPQTPVRVIGCVEHGRLNLAIADMGRGMTEEQVLKIGAFMQFDRHLYEQQGLGIGLKLVKKIIEKAQGNFAITSSPGEGTIIRISLPAKVLTAR